MRTQIAFTVLLAVAFLACALVLAWAQYQIARYTSLQGASPKLFERLNEVEANVAGARRQLAELDATVETRFKSLYGRLGGRPRRPGSTGDSDDSGEDVEATPTAALAAQLTREMASAATPNAAENNGVTWAGGYPIFRK